MPYTMYIAMGGSRSSEHLAPPWRSDQIVVGGRPHGKRKYATGRAEDGRVLTDVERHPPPTDEELALDPSISDWLDGGMYRAEFESALKFYGDFNGRILVTWVGVEADADTETNANAYRDRLEQLIADSRAIATQPVFWVLELPHRDVTRSHAGKLRAAMRAIAAVDSQVIITDANDIPMVGGLHRPRDKQQRQGKLDGASKRAWGF